ncbi:MAG: hypothetical protein BECKG1743D_GA0114223_101773 [Candidatus Kentron sp. G]|nr:MAG: hypothetical protein BECKG1743F_GA0114225_101453 [Candidatus Kentron sp. G]VFM97772.1 MAG: hypothetical protein BECKG1743E_GA0114224_101503 [Candidatus Kentron sp. G]VFN00240.1 MAG: hypothetical protein BECKG1743D_GA0114223_101773 [Candidatus Kentron sp. G]
MGWRDWTGEHGPLGIAIEKAGIRSRLLLDSGLMAKLCNYPSQIDMDGRMFGGEHLGSPYAPPNVRANLVFAHYA